jgi:small nuclear ribonucleoprotein (snRNP)-like protein
VKKILSAAAAFLFATALAFAWQYPTGGPPSSSPTWGIGRGSSETKREKPPEFRNLTGVVLDKADSPVKDAIVYLKNRKTKALTTFIADADGAFRFPNLSRTEDYEVYAELKGQKSLVKTLSSFDSRTNAKINLYVEPADEKKDAKKEEKTVEQVAKKDEKKAENKEEKKDQPK